MRVVGLKDKACEVVIGMNPVSVWFLGAFMSKPSVCCVVDGVDVAAAVQVIHRTKNLVIQVSLRRIRSRNEDPRKTEKECNREDNSALYAYLDDNPRTGIRLPSP